MVAAGPLRIVFFGTPAFAVPTLEALLSSRHPVVGVVTQPDRPRGRGQNVVEGAVKARALQASLHVLQPTSIKDPAFLTQLAELRTDLGVVAAYGKILTEAVLSTPRLGMINVHASLLPRYRGAAPIQRAVAAGESETGITIMRVVRALDAGAMLATAHRPIGPDETADDVERDLARLGGLLLAQTVDRLAAGPIEEVPQNDHLATYAHRLTKEDGLVVWTQSAHRVHDLVRGMHPWPHAYSYLNGQRLILLRSSAEDGAEGSPVTPPGTILEAKGDTLRVSTGAGVINVLELQAEGKRPMRTREFLSGHRIIAGDRFTSAP
ncbi:MAG: methionyl-tRNA formyltransferase [Acidimicrobiia bacterium]|nr:methionyl-tRNA formyltransferase [Acidimicrobiia bacterium]